LASNVAPHSASNTDPLGNSIPCLDSEYKALCSL
jgi:hypothetical protein